MDRDELEGTWLEADKVRGDRPLDLGALLSAAAKREPVTWQLVAELSLRDRHSGLGRPLFLLEFVSQLSRALAPASILDPWVTTPTMLASAQETAPKARCIGLVKDSGVHNVAGALSSCEWRSGDPFALLDELSRQKFDLLLLSPPLGAQAHDVRPDDPPSTKRELADLALWRARPHLQSKGHALFHTSDTFLWSVPRQRFQAELEGAGLYLHAVVSVDGGMAPLSSIATSFLFLGDEPTAELFIARLDQVTPIPELVENLVARRAAVNPELGALIAPQDFHGWRSYFLEQEIAELYGPHQLQSIGEVGSVRRVELKPEIHYEVPANCVFVPSLGFGAVMTALPDLEGKKRYSLIEVQLDPGMVRAEYAAACLSSPIGRRLRESVNVGSSVPHLTAGGLSRLRIPIPPLAVQDQAAGAAAHLVSMEAVISRLRTDLWRRPEGAVEVLARLENEAKADPVRRWIDTLPFPMASVLHRYTAERDGDAKVSRLLHFFEVTAEFGCAVLIGVLQSVPDLLARALPELSRAAPDGRPILQRADFGLWMNLGRTLAKAIRRLGGDGDQRERITDSAEPASELVTRLTEKTIWQVLDGARAVRNQRAHAGVVNSDQVASWLSALQGLLSDAEQALANGFDDIDLVRAEEGRFRAGIHIYDWAQRLRGPSDVFEEIEVRSRVPLESDHVAFVSRVLTVTPVLKLAPLVRVGPTASSSRNACYFVDSRLAGGAFSYVSYHFEDQPRIEVDDPELEELARQLTPTLP